MKLKCQYCQGPATLVLVEIIQKQRKERPMCEACAREHNLLADAPDSLNIPAILKLVFQQMPPVKPATTGEAVCPECGIPYAHFRSKGRLGCPHDYDVFRGMLEPLLEKVQNNIPRHVGKIPRRHRRRMNSARRVELEAQLRSAVTAERYEEAARLRDAIQILGSEHES